MSKLQSINPSNYEVLEEVPTSSPNYVVSRIQLAHLAKKEWANLGVANRVEILRKVVAEFESRKSEFALLESQEMGMPINETMVDYDGTLFFANWYLDNAEKYLSPETTFENDKEINLVYHEPLGVAAVIIPWNYPFLNFVWSCFQSLIAGNVIVLKHSEEVPLCGKLIEDVMTKHLPKGVFNEVYGDGEVGNFLTDMDVNFIHFVGSAKTGWSLYEKAAKKKIKAVTELGGSAPGIVFEDADIDSAVRSICEFRLTNAGQYCDGLKRLIVHENVFDEVVEKVAAVFSAKKVGVAEDPTTELGPLAAKRQLDLLIQQVEDAHRKVVRYATGGYPLEKELNGAFFRPTLLTDVRCDMRVWREEVFGPVLPVVKFFNEAEAVRFANDTTYGLGSYVYTQDKERAKRVARLLDTGMVSINAANYTQPWNPFGGYKQSGMGREHGKYGFHGVTQLKTIASPK